MNPPPTASSDAPPDELLGIADPNETALLDVLRSRIGRRMLEEIASSDYGEEISDHLAGTEKQISSIKTIGRLEWCPREVLELERWNEPEEGKSEQDRQAAHLKRLLACMILLRNAGHMMPNPIRLPEDDFFLETSAASVIRLLRSAIALGSFYERPALAFNLWLYRTQPYPRLRPFVAVSSALLGIVISPPRGNVDSERRLLAWVDTIEASCRASLGAEVESERWLIGLNSYENRSGHGALWFETMRRIASQREATAPLLSWIETHLTRSPA